jgi:TetR/AcrR family transcriptional regulator, regulator of autoinduction and epiphytic fitness
MAGRAAAAVDGRFDRVARSRTLICDACLDLIQEGVLQPSADQIADRAGLSRRSIFNQFSDLAALYDAVVEAGMRRCAPLLAEIPRELPVAERTQRLVDARARFFEATTAFARALTAQALVGAAPEQAWRVAKAALAAQLADVDRVFGPELDQLAPAARAETLEALAGAASAPHWEYLRRSRGLSPSRARAVLTRTLRALLADAGGAPG